MLKRVLLVVAVVFVALLAFVASRPAHFRIVRSADMRAPREIVFPLVNDLRRWREWSPWENIDPQMTRDYSGPPAGEGAVYAWQGNDEVGSGSMTITESVPPERIDLELEFVTPFAATNQVSFGFEPIRDGTRLTWAMEGDNGFIGKALSLFMDFDAMIGAQYDTGLAAIKRIAESESAAAS